MSDQFNNHSNQHDDQAEHESKQEGDQTKRDQNQQSNYRQSLDEDSQYADTNSGYRHYTYGDSGYRIYREPSANNNNKEPNRYAVDFHNVNRQDNSNQNRSYDSDDIRQMIREEIKQAKPRHRFLRGLALVLVGIILATTGTYILQSTGILGERNKVQNVETQTVKQEPRQLNISIKEDGTVENAVAAKAIPSIVGITALVRGESQMNPFFFYNEVPKYKEGVGSGVIVDPEGYILTNSHVVNNDEAEKLTVSFADSEKAEAELVWHDQTLDLAVIKVDKTNLPAVELGDSDEVQVGDKAIAVGNPLGLDLQSTLTSGYISGLNRTIQVQDGQSINILDGLMQTDAAINSGNSGGALLNVNGEVIGINTARPQTADGIGFAIPINVAKPIIAEIKEHGSYESVYFGISGVNMQMVTIMNSEEELPTETGVLVDQVMDNSPAEKAGLESGDIIYAIDEQPVDSFNSLKTQLLKYKTGDKAEVSIYRGQKEMTLEIEFTNFSFDSIVG